MPEFISEKQLHFYSTKRLNLTAATLEHVNAELESPGLLAEMLNAIVTPEWPPGEYDENAQNYFRDQLIKHGEEIVGWLCWYAVTKPTKKEPAVLIAAGGFMCPPSETGEVEIGYSVVESYQRKGYASEMVQALVEIACKNPCVRRIVARINERNTASRSLIESIGFRNTNVIDQDNNLVFEKIV